MAVIIIVFTIVVAGSLGFFLMEQSSKRYANALKKISNTEVIDIIRQHNGQIGIEDFVSSTGLSREDAKYKLSAMLSQRILSIEYNDRFETVYALSDIVKSALYDVNSTFYAYKRALHSIPDAEVIRIAVEQHGRVTPASLCFKANISADEAKVRLEELYQKGIFELDVTENGTLCYQLTDKDLYEEL
ncbi:hypothetical protein V6R21_20870 [Limibacter armeniacum]|uniref:hypothetical protein n=1 Tax=Limibacter armeniacum TaxID=466084 RepID=UPI002FE50D69